jgi:hypothetical protein
VALGSGIRIGDLQAIAGTAEVQACHQLIASGSSSRYFRESLTLAGAGVALGLLISLAVTRYLETLLFGVKPTDPAVYASVAILMLSVGALHLTFLRVEPRR